MPTWVVEDELDGKMLLFTVKRRTTASGYHTALPQALHRVVAATPRQATSTKARRNGGTF